MIYLLSTNRPKWSEFAYRQFLKTNGCRLVVLDNHKDRSQFWNKVDCEYLHIPDKKNVSEMFNHYADIYDGDEDLFYMDDDIEISKNTVSTMKRQFELGFDCVKNCRVHVTHGKKSGIWHRASKNIGACWMSKNCLWQNARFDESTIEGVCSYFRDLRSYNCRLLHLPELANYMIHDDNEVLKASKFNFNMDKITLE